MSLSARERFLAYVRAVPGARPVVSPFLPHAPVVQATLRCLGLPVAEDDFVQNEILLARALDYEPMFMTDCPGLIFPWQEDAGRSDEQWIFYVLNTRRGPWERRVSRALGQWGDDSGFPVKTEEDHQFLLQVCAEIGDHEGEIRRYFKEWRERVGDEGVIVVSHPHVTWLAYQISQQNLIYHYNDYRETFWRSMEAIYQAALFVFSIGMEEGMDFTSESCYGMEMISPARFDEQDLPYLQRFADWTHQRGGLFWYHNCGMTRELIRSGRFNLFRPDVLETVAPPPEGDNDDLGASRRFLDPTICTKGNLNLRTLRDGSVEDVVRETRAMVAAVRGYRHIHSTADAVLTGTPPENMVAFVRTAREAAVNGR
jgi:uroporphyrinogen-III decarboxylase